uniref:Uncharacterized protein n=1 Tax=Theileria annulata TaxID=5874 RepID=A0A3B0MP20_THEAN
MIPYFLLTFIIVKYAFSVYDPTFYILDKDFSLNTNSLFNELCLGTLSKNVVCIILKPDVLNNLICYDKCCLMCVNRLQMNKCYYSDYLSPKCSGTILYPLIDTKSSYAVPSNSDTSLIELGNSENPDGCATLIDETCRINRDFSHSMDVLVPGRKSNVLSIRLNPSKAADRNFIIQELDFSLPPRDEFLEYLNTIITDNFYPHVKQYLKNVEKMLKFRECVLLNELDIIFHNITQFPLTTYRRFELHYLYTTSLTLFLRIMTFKTFLVSGFSNFAYIVYKKLEELWINIVESDLKSVVPSISKFLSVYDSYEVDLYSELRLIMDPAVYNEILTNSISYSKQIEGTKGELPRIERDELITESNEFLKKINLLLTKQCEPPSTYGPQCTVRFFKGLEDKYNKF